MGTIAAWLDAYIKLCINTYLKGEEKPEEGSRVQHLLAVLGLFGIHTRGVTERMEPAGDGNPKPSSSAGDLPPRLPAAGADQPVRSGINEHMVSAAVDEALAFDRQLTTLRDALQQGDKGDSLSHCIRHVVGPA